MKRRALLHAKGPKSTPAKRNVHGHEHIALVLPAREFHLPHLRLSGGHNRKSIINKKTVTTDLVTPTSWPRLDESSLDTSAHDQLESILL